MAIINTPLLTFTNSLASIILLHTSVQCLLLFQVLKSQPLSLFKSCPSPTI